MRFIALAAFVCLGGGSACTLLNSEGGLVGPPLAADSGAGSGSPADGSPVTSPFADAGLSPETGGGGGGPGDGGSTHGDATIIGQESDAATGSEASPPPPADAGPVAIYSGRISPLGIAVHNGTICWVEGDSIRTIECAPTAGGGASDVTTLASQSNDAFVVDAFDVALDDNYLYWSNGPNNQIVRKARSAGTSAQYFTGDNHVSYIVLDGTDVWVTDYVAGSTSGNIVVGGASSSSSTLVYPSEEQAAGVAVYSGSVYWGRTAPDSVSFGPVAGNAAVTRVDAGARVTGLAIDSSGTVYFLAGNQDVYRLPFGGQTPELVYDEASSFGDSDLAVDDGAIYWSEHDLGRIMRVAK